MRRETNNNNCNNNGKSQELLHQQQQQGSQTTSKTKWPNVRLPHLYFQAFDRGSSAHRQENGCVVDRRNASASRRLLPALEGEDLLPSRLRMALRRNGCLTLLLLLLFVLLRLLSLLLLLMLVLLLLLLVQLLVAHATGAAAHAAAAPGRCDRLNN